MSNIQVPSQVNKDGKLIVQGKDNYGKPAQEYVDTVVAMSDEELLVEGEMKIWLSAYASNNPNSDYHWHVDVLYVVMNSRDPRMYDTAWNRAAATMEKNYYL